MLLEIGDTETGGGVGAVTQTDSEPLIDTAVEDNGVLYLNIKFCEQYCPYLSIYCSTNYTVAVILRDHLT